MSRVYLITAGIFLSSPVHSVVERTITVNGAGVAQCSISKSNNNCPMMLIRNGVLRKRAKSKAKDELTNICENHRGNANIPGRLISTSYKRSNCKSFGNRPTVFKPYNLKIFSCTVRLSGKCQAYFKN